MRPKKPTTITNHEEDHAVDLDLEGFELVAYDWNEDTGESVSSYERHAADLPDGKPLYCERYRQQPAGRRHLGWRWYDGRRTTGYDEDGNTIVQ